MAIDRCICFDVSFAQLKEYAREHGCGLDELRARFGCGRGCALCLPYINAMLATGQTSFPPDWKPDATPTSQPPENQ